MTDILDDLDFDDVIRFVKKVCDYIANKNKKLSNLEVVSLYLLAKYPNATGDNAETVLKILEDTWPKEEPNPLKELSDSIDKSLAKLNIKSRVVQRSSKK